MSNAARQVGSAPTPVDVTGDLHLFARGDGPGVVFTHGFADDSTTFDALIAEVGQVHRVVTWDLPGHGHSPLGRHRSTRATGLAGLGRAIDAAGQRPVTLIGHSLGGYLSLCRAALAPGGVAGLVLIATGPGFRDPDKRAAWNERISAYAAKRGVAPQAVGLAEQPDGLVIERLASITAPTLVVVGREDRAYHRGAELMARAMPDATLLVVAGAGHFPHRTHTPEVAQAVGVLLDQVRSST